MMKIQRIQKTKTGKYKIVLDDKTITTYDDVILKNGLLYKKEIDISIYEQMNRDHYYYEVYNKTLNYISKRIRCTKEIELYLDKFDLDKEDKDKIIKHLEDIGFLNDSNYVKSYISDSLYLKNNGPCKIKDELLSLDIPSELIDNEIENIDEEFVREKAIKLIDKKLKNNRKYSEYQLRQKINIEMLNLGYPSYLINDILEDISYNDDAFLEKEYDILYAKLSKKYSDYDLFNKIKQKLYSKGFDINKINEIIAKKKDDF